MAPLADWSLLYVELPTNSYRSAHGAASCMAIRIRVLKTRGKLYAWRIDELEREKK